MHEPYLTEQVNQEIEAYLSIYCASHPEDWLQALHTLEFTHNNRRHADRQNTKVAEKIGIFLLCLFLLVNYQVMCVMCSVSAL